MVMTYCPGGDLGKSIKNNNKFNENIAKLYIAEITLAIETLH